MGAEAKYVKRVQAMFTEEQFNLLLEHAEQTDTPVSRLVREAVETYLLVDLEEQRRREALEWMAGQDLPVDDWEVMERQAESRWEGCEDG